MSSRYDVIATSGGSPPERVVAQARQHRPDPAGAHQ
jgi:hypothetical protein